MHHARGKNKSVTTQGQSRSNMKYKSFYYVISQRISAYSLWRILCNYNQVHKYALNIMTLFICAIFIGQEILTSKFHAVENKIV